MADKLFDVMLAVDTALVEQFGNALVFRRVQIAEAVIFQLPLQLTNPQPVRQRRIDVCTLFGGQHALVFRRILHLSQMGNTLGQLDYHAAEIIHHGQQHPANVIDLLR